MRTDKMQILSRQDRLHVTRERERKREMHMRIDKMQLLSVQYRLHVTGERERGGGERERERERCI